MFIVSGNSFSVNQFGVAVYRFSVLIVNIRKKILIDTREREVKP